MENTSLEQMMHFMLESKKQSFYISIIFCTIVFIILMFMAFLADRLLFRINYLKMFRICSIIFGIIYFCLIGINIYNYKHGYKNQGPWSGGIYEAYYECEKCKSLAGGIFGKGPTKWSITNKECFHDWNAIYRKDFEVKLEEKK